MFFFQSAPCHINLERTPLWSQTGFQNKQNRQPQVKSRILMSKIRFESLWLQNYKRARISFTFNFFTLSCENNWKRGRNPKSSTFQETGLCFYSTPRHRSPHRHPRRLQTGFHNNQCGKRWMRNYKRARISDTVPFGTLFSWKYFKERTQFKKPYLSRSWVIFSVNSMPQKPTKTSEITNGLQNDHCEKVPMNNNKLARTSDFLWFFN